MIIGLQSGGVFQKGLPIRKSTEKCIWEGVPEMGFSAGFLIRKGFSVCVPHGVPDHVLEPPAPLVTPVCPCRSLVTYGRHWWLISRRSWAMGLQERMHQKGSKCPKCKSQGLDQAPMCVGRYYRVPQ